MAKIKIRQFKGLIAYGDLADSSLEYSSKFKNIYTEGTYISNQGINTIDVQHYIPTDETILKLKYVYLDEDIYKDKVVNNLLLQNDYKPNLTKHLIIITKKNNSYYIYCDNKKITSFEYTSEELEQPEIYNDNKVAKIFFKKEAFVLKKYYRHYLDIEDNIQVYKDIKVNPLIYDMKKDNPDIGTFRVVTNLSGEEPLTVTAHYAGRGEYELNGEKYYTTKIRLEHNGKNIIYPSDDGYLNLFEGFIFNIFQPTYVQPVFILYDEPNKRIIKNYDNIFLNKENDYTYIYKKEQNNTVNVKASNFGNHIYIYADPNYSNISYFPSPLQINPAYTSIIYDEYRFKSHEKVRIATTIETDQGEFLYKVSEVYGATEDFILKLDSINTHIINRDWIAIHFYLEVTSVLKTEELNLLEIADFEQIHTINFRKKLKLSSDDYIYISKITPNGIKLHHRIGTVYNSTYEIIKAINQYIVINGIAFIINKGNVYYNAVGAGKQLINNFYPQNIIPFTNADLLIKIGNNLGIANKEKDKIIILDYQPTEAGLIFFVKNELEKIPKNQYDVVETPGGTFISTSEGILLSNGYQNTYVLTQIKDIIKSNYKNSKLLYNSKSSMLYLIAENKIYGYSILTTSVSEYTFSKLDIIDFTVDDLGNIYFLVEDDGHRKIKKMIYTKDVEGEIEYKNVDLNEISVKKLLNYIIFDYEGRIEFNNQHYESDIRKFITVPLRFDERQYKDFLEFKFKFKGKIYSLELDYEYINYNKF